MTKVSVNNDDKGNSINNNDKGNSFDNDDSRDNVDISSNVAKDADDNDGSDGDSVDNDHDLSPSILLPDL